MKKKRIVLGLPKSFSMFEAIKKNMEFYGYEVISICYEDHNYSYKGIGQRVYNFFRKTFFNDKHYKNRLKFQPYRKEIESVINSIEGKVDYTLLIRADIYPLDILKKLKKKSHKFIAYQWDGLHRFPAIYSYIELFDRFFIFDKTDLNYKKTKLLPITNFYCDYDMSLIPIELCEFDVFFVGSFIRKRMPQIQSFITYTKRLNLKLNINIFISSESDKKQFKIEEIKYIDRHMTYENNINQLKNSKIVIDFLNETHKGLSFRTFEALYYQKKLITNNPEVKKYDFYNPNNIFVWDGVNLDGIENFIKVPYVLIDENIKFKYSFKNWLNYVLGEGKYTPIELPE